MSLIWTIILAIVQGLTEFLPVSSSGHLTILGAIEGLSEKDALVFFLVLHMGTLLATLVYFWRELLNLALGAFKGKSDAWRYIGLMVVTSIPTAIIGLSLKGVVERAVTHPAVAGGFLLFTALFLWGTRYLPRGTKTDGTISWLDAALIGTAQGVAVFPGISRSGATISSALARGLEPEAAFRFSFIASLPAIAGAFLLDARDALSSANPHLADDIVGFSIAFIVGLAALWLLKRIVDKGRLYQFSLWCLIVGLAGIGVWFFKG